MAASNEADGRNRQKRALQAVINEKRAELDRFGSKIIIFCLLFSFNSKLCSIGRYNIQLQSLERIEAEQKSMLEKIINAQS